MRFLALIFLFCASASFARADNSACELYVSPLTGLGKDERTFIEAPLYDVALVNRNFAESDLVLSVFLEESPVRLTIHRTEGGEQLGELRAAHFEELVPQFFTWFQQQNLPCSI